MQNQLSATECQIISQKKMTFDIFGKTPVTCFREVFLICSMARNKENLQTSGT